MSLLSCFYVWYTISEGASAGMGGWRNALCIAAAFAVAACVILGSVRRDDARRPAILEVPRREPPSHDRPKHPCSPCPLHTVTLRPQPNGLEWGEGQERIRKYAVHT